MATEVENNDGRYTVAVEPLESKTIVAVEYHGENPFHVRLQYKDYSEADRFATNLVGTLQGGSPKVDSFRAWGGVLGSKTLY